MEIREFHWLVTIIQNLEVGLVVLDKQNQIEIWNSFMESHSSRLGHEVKVVTIEGGNLQHSALFEKWAEILGQGHLVGGCRRLHRVCQSV